MSSTNKPVLRIDWATHEAAKFACVNWHYSKSVPAGKIVKIGVWEDGKFIGVVLFSRGATPQIGSPYGLTQLEICELTRVALSKHVTPVSRILSIAIKYLKQNSVGLRLIVSFADASRNHHGGIYQACGWVYLGGNETHAYLVNGIKTHPKTLHSRYGKGGQSIPWLQSNVDPHAQRVVAGFKHRYLMPLDAEMRKQIEPLAKPYPKRTKKQDVESHSTLGGAIPTRALQINETV